MYPVTHGKTVREFAVPGSLSQDFFNHFPV